MMWENSSQIGSWCCMPRDGCATVGLAALSPHGTWHGAAINPFPKPENWSIETEVTHAPAVGKGRAGPRCSDGPAAYLL